MLTTRKVNRLSKSFQFFIVEHFDANVLHKADTGKIIAIHSLDLYYYLHTVCAGYEGYPLEQREAIVILFVGQNAFTIRISRECIKDEKGGRLWAQCDPVKNEIAISRQCPKHQWLRSLRHEYWHAWCLYNPEPKDEEDGAIMFSNVADEFEQQFARQGGLEALLAMAPSRSRSPALIPLPPIANDRALTRGVKFWLTEWGHGDTARPGVLITSDSGCPMPLGFVDGNGSAAREMAWRIASGDEPMTKANFNLEYVTVDRFPIELAGNLLFPVRPFREEWLDESDESRAAARYTPTTNGTGLASFTTFTRDGLLQLLQKIPVMRCNSAREPAAALSLIERIGGSVSTGSRSRKRI